MQKDNLTPSQFKNHLEKTYQLLSGSDSERDSKKTEMFASIIRNMHYFQRNLEAPANLYDFTQFAKSYLNYEVHPYGTVLKKEGEYSDKLSIVLKGTVLKVQPRPYDDIEKEIKKRHPPAPKEQSATKSQTEIIPKRNAPRYRQHTLATSKKMGVSRSRGYIKTMNRLGTLNDNSTEETPKSSKVVHARTVSNLDNVQNTRPQLLHKNSSLNELDWDDNQVKEENGSIGSGVFSERGSLKRLDTYVMSKSLYPAGSLENLSEFDCDDELRKEEIEKRIKARKELEKQLKLDELIMTEADVQFLEYVASNCPDIRPKLFLTDILRVKKSRIYKPAELFGEGYYKETRPQENYTMIANSEEVHLLTLSRESYQVIMAEICEQAKGKANFFIDLFPSFDQETVKKFSYNFSERHFKRNERIFEENDPAQELYLLKSGQVQLSKTVDPATQLNQGIPNIMPTSPKQFEKIELPIASIIKQQFFGEEVMLREPRRYYSAVAINSGTSAFFVEPRVYHSVKEEFGDLLSTLKQQTRDRFLWRQQRTFELIEQKRQQTTKAYFDAAKLEKGMKSPKNNQSSPGFSIPIIAKMGKVTDSIKSNRQTDDTIMSEERDIQQIRGLVLKTNRVLVLENTTMAKNLDLYKAKYSRKAAILDKSNTEDEIFKKRGDRPRLATEVSNGPNPFNFNVRKELSGKKNNNRTKLPQISSYQYIGSAQNLDDKNNSLVREFDIDYNFVSLKASQVHPKSTVFDRDEQGEHIGNFKSKLRDMIQGISLPSSVRGLVKKMEEGPFGNGTPSKGGVNNIHVARLPKKLTVIQKARKTSQERVDDTNFEGVAGRKTELQLKGI